jgi:predicted DNA-binding transcriptional regulator AlpA
VSDRRALLLEMARSVAPDQGLTVPASWLLELLRDSDQSDGPELTVPELAKLLTRSEATVRTRLERGDFPGAYKLGGKAWRIPPAAFTAFRKEQASRPQESKAVSLSDWRRPPAA